MACSAFHFRVFADKLAKRAVGLFDALWKRVAVPPPTVIAITASVGICGIFVWARQCTGRLIFVRRAAFTCHRCSIVLESPVAGSANESVQMLVVTTRATAIARVVDTAPNGWIHFARAAPIATRCVQSVGIAAT